MIDETEVAAEAETPEVETHVDAEASAEPAAEEHAEVAAEAETEVAAEVVEPAPEPVATVRMHNEHGTGCSFRGVDYEPDHDGAVTVPARAVAELESHGFTVVGE